jgi:hypothetical protein
MAPLRVKRGRSRFGECAPVLAAVKQSARPKLASWHRSTIVTPLGNPGACSATTAGITRCVPEAQEQVRSGSRMWILLELISVRPWWVQMTMALTSVA